MKIFACRCICVLFVLSMLPQLMFAQAPRDELTAYNEPPSRLRGLIEKFDQDTGILNRFYTAQTSANRSARFRQLYADELSLLGRLNFDTLNHDEQVDYILFKNDLDHSLKEMARNDAQLAEMAALIPFAKTINDLEDTRRTLKDVDSAKTATVLNDLVKQITATQRSFEGANAAKPKRTVAARTARTVDTLPCCGAGTAFTIFTIRSYVVERITIQGG
jgi:hypothetical protein